jgi:hypothetical protein
MSAEDRDTELGWPFGRNTWPYVVGTEYVFGATVWGYEGGDGNAVAWSGTSIAPLRYHFNADGDLDRPPVDVGARLREDLRLGGVRR